MISTDSPTVDSVCLFVISLSTTALSHLKLASSRTCCENCCAERLRVALEWHSYCDFTDYACYEHMWVTWCYRWTHCVCINDISHYTGVCALAVLCINFGTLVFVLEQSDVYSVICMSVYSPKCLHCLSGLHAWNVWLTSKLCTELSLECSSVVTLIDCVLCCMQHPLSQKFLCHR